MKVRLKKKQNRRSMTLLIIAGLLLVPIGFKSATIAGTLFIIWISVVIGLLNDYEITDKDRLKDYPVSIDIHRIRKIVKEENGLVVVYYNRKKDGSIQSRQFTPKDTNTFVSRLKGINKNIQII